MYLLGYAVECSLKARLLETYDCYTLDELQRRLSRDESKVDVYTHSLGRLMELAVPSQQRPAHLRGALGIVQKWDVAWRYRGVRSDDATQAKEFFSAAERVLEFLRTPLVR